MANKIIDELKWRGFYADSLGKINEALVPGESFYLGCDPTSVQPKNRNPKYPNVTTSLHIGHLSALVCAKHLQLMGMTPILLIGDYTAKFGDASFKDCERPILSYEEIANNTSLIQTQLERLFGTTEETGTRYVRNGEWMDSVGLVDFMRHVGSHLTVNYLMAKDALKNRFQKDGVGLSVLSFIYPLIQANDMLALREKYGCKVELAGNDQMGNVSTSFELNRKIGGEDNLAAWFIPLVTDSNGQKFGKSAGKAIYLDSRLTSPFEFYQFWFNQPDDMSEILIKKFTFLSREEIEKTITEHKTAPEKRLLQTVLAKYVTEMVHGKEALDKALAASEILFGKSTPEDLMGLDEETMLAAMRDVKKVELTYKDVVGNNVTDIANLANVGSKSEIRKLIKSNGFSINKKKVSDTNTLVAKSSLLKGKYLLLQKGKKDYTLAIVN